MAEIGKNIRKAKEILENGGLVAIPTETVYGLAGNAFNEDAVSSIFEVKNRPKFDPLILHSNSLEKINDFIAWFPKNALPLSRIFWPGPLTLVLPKNNKIPDIVSSGLSTIAVRIPAKSLTLNLLSQLDFPLVAPSANPFGYVSPTSPVHVNDQLGDKIEYILDGGPCGVGIESTIIGFEEEIPTIYRLGGIGVEEIESLLGTVHIQPSTSNPKAPGMLTNHYSPGKQVILGKISELINEFDSNEIALLTFSEKFATIAEDRQIMLSKGGDLAEASQKLFASLRALDQMPVKFILAESMPEKGLGRAINDRLQRAASDKKVY